jgi:type IV pilus assembly protein PilN
MIRINLLTTDRGVPVKKRAAGGGITAAQRLASAAALILLATVVLIGWWFWSLRQQGQRLDSDIARAETRANQLRSVLASVQKFEARKAQLQQRVTLIEQLRRGQQGPVHFLDEVSKALPDRLWLVSMQQRGAEFTMAGQTTSLTAVSDFVANLEASKWFHPVDVVDSTVEPTPNGDLVRFTVRAVSVNPEAPPTAPAPGRGAPPAR